MGEMNTWFFHNMASARKNITSISKFQRVDGTWAIEKTAIDDIDGGHFSNLFAASSDERDFGSALRRVGQLVTSDMNENLTRPFTLEEFKQAAFQMHPDKAPAQTVSTQLFFLTILGHAQRGYL